MYTERKFKTWRVGLIHLVIAVGCPLIPILVYRYMQWENIMVNTVYLCTLLITVSVTFLYEYLYPPYDNAGRLLKVENIACSFALTIALLTALFVLFTAVTKPDAPVDEILLYLAGIPLLCGPTSVTLVEIARAVKYDVTSSGYQPEGQSIVKGAAKV